MRQYFSSFEFFFLNRLGLWTLGMPGVWVWVTGETLSALAWPSLQSQLRERRDQTPAPGWHRPHPQTSMGGPKQKNYTHFFNAFYIIHIHLGILQGRRLTQSPRNDSHFLGYFFSPLIPYIFHSYSTCLFIWMVKSHSKNDFTPLCSFRKPSGSLGIFDAVWNALVVRLLAYVYIRMNQQMNKQHWSFCTYNHQIHFH